MRTLRSIALVAAMGSVVAGLLPLGARAKRGEQEAGDRIPGDVERSALASSAWEGLAPDGHDGGAPLVRLARPDDADLGWPTVLALSDDGSFLAVGYEDGVVFTWSSRSLDPIDRSLVLPAQVNALDVSPDGRTLALGTERGEVYLSGTDSDAPLVHLDSLTGPLAGLEISPDGRLLAMATPQSVVIRRLPKRDIVFEGAPRTDRARIESLRFSSDGTELIAVLRIDGEPTRWILRASSVDGLAVTGEWAGSGTAIDAVELSADGGRICWSDEAGIACHDRGDSGSEPEFHVSIEWGSRVVIAQDARHACVAAPGEAIVVYDLGTGEQVASFSSAGHPRVKVMSLSRDSSLVVAGMIDSSVLLWSVD